MIRMRTTGLALAAMLSSILAACSSSPNNSSAGSSTSTPSGTVSGAASKGLLLNAPVAFYAVSNGTVGTTAIGTTTTSSTNGTFSSTVSSSGPVVVTVTVNSSTQMLDELSGTAIAAPSGLVLHAVFDSLTDLQPIAVTPLTEMAYQTALAASGGLTTTNIDTANNDVSTLFLGGASALYTQPIALSSYATATAAEQALEKLLTALDIAADSGLAVNASGQACTGTYAQELVCMVSGLPSLLTISSSGVSPTANAGYLTVAYTDLDDDASVTVNGGESPSALGLDVATTAETSFVSAYQQQNLPLPGFSSSGDPLTNTKDLIANIRTNIIDQSATQTFGYAPTLTALDSDLEQNVEPAVLDTSSLVGTAYLAAELLQYSLGSAGYGTPSSLLGNPYGVAADAAGNLYLANLGNDTVIEVSTSGAVSLLAGQASVAGETNETTGTPTSATFDLATGIAVDSSDDVFVGDLGAVREISGGNVTTLAGAGTAGLGTNNGTGTSAEFVLPLGMTLDSSGNLYVVDEGGAGGTAIREVTQAGVVSTIVRSTALDGADGIALYGGDFYVTNSTSDIIQEIIPGSTPTITTIAGQSGVAGDANGTGTAATFNAPIGITVDASGNLYVGDSGNAAVREITPAGVVTTVAQTSTKGAIGGFVPNLLGGVGIALTGGNLYVTNARLNSVEEVSDGVVSPLVHGTTNYQGHCGYDPTTLGTGTDSVLCHYGHGQNEEELTLTQTGTGTYTLETQPLVSNPNGCTGGNAVIACPLTPGAETPLQSQFTSTTSGTGASASLDGPYYVTSAGGQVTGDLSIAESSNWNEATGSGTLTLSGSLSGGSGGVSLTNATIGSDTALTVENLFSGSLSLKTLLAAKAPVETITGTVDLQQLTTDAFSYAADVSLGTPVFDASGLVAVPESVSFTGSIDQVATSGTSPLFNGTVGVNVTGFSSYNATQAISATNNFTLQAQVSGTLDLTDNRVLTVTAEANASQITPTPAQPDSITVTYSYATPSGTAQLNASGQYDATNGLSGTITNNAGVVIAVSKPIGGTLAGTITASGTETATINGDFVYFSDDTSQSLF